MQSKHQQEAFRVRGTPRGGAVQRPQKLEVSVGARTSWWGLTGSSWNYRRGVCLVAGRRKSLLETPPKIERGDNILNYPLSPLPTPPFLSMASIWHGESEKYMLEGMPALWCKTGGEWGMALKANRPMMGHKTRYKTVMKVRKQIWVNDMHVILTGNVDWEVG